MSIIFSEFITEHFPLEDGNNNIATTVKQLPEEFLRTFSDRKDLIAEIFEVFSEEENKIIYLNSTSGAGKTGLLKTVAALLENNALTHYYECSEVTNLDDILLSIFHYLKKNTPRDADYIRNFRISASFSLDERVMNRIKNLEKPLLLVLDGAENIFRNDREDVSKELLTFLHFVQAIPAIRIIIAGETPLKADEIKLHPIQVEGLNRETAVDFIKNLSISGAEEVISDIYNLTGGFPEKILLFAMLSKLLDFSADELVEKIRSSGMGFEKYVDEMVYSLIPEEYRELTGFFALARHPFSVDTLKKLDVMPKIEEKIAFLNTLMVLSENNGSLQIKQPLKSHITSRLSLDEKVNIHATLEELYARQIISKLENRILPVSRKTLHSEQFYHRKCLAKFDGTENQQIKPSAGNEYDYESLHSYDEDIKIRLTEEEKALIEEEAAHEQATETDNSTDDKKNTDNTRTKKASQADLHKLSEEELKEMLANYQKQGDSLNYNSVLYNLGNLHREHFRHEQALMHYYSVLNAAPEDISDSILFNLYENLGEIFSFRQDFTTALNWYNKALKAAEANNNTAQLAEIYFKLALAYDDAEDYDMALRYYARNIDTSVDTDINQFLSASYSNIAAIFEERIHMIKAIEYYEKALEVDIRTNDLEGQYEALSKLGDMHFETENYPTAAKCFYKELTIAKQINDPYKIAMSYIDIGDIFLFEKNYEKTIRAFILAKKTIQKTVSTDSREKIDRRFRQIVDELGKDGYMELIGKIKGKHA